MAKNAAFSGYRWTYFESMQEGPVRTRAEVFLRSADWSALLEYATKRRSGVRCALSSNIGLGYNHMVRVLEFLDGTKWVARLRMPSLDEDFASSPDSVSVRQRMEAEYNTALLVLAKTSIPVPAIHAIESTSENIVKVPFMLMDCISGNVGMDLGMTLPSQHKSKFIKYMADIHTELSTLKLPKIGTYLGMNDDDSYKQGPIPGLGGPFNTAAEFFEAWAKKARFPVPEDRVRAMAGEFADEILSGISQFPSGIRQFATKVALSASNNGPFPFCHGDFGHNNIVVNDEYDVLSVIDWEMSYAGPWELFGDFPLTLSVVPAPIDVPWNYDDRGNPKDNETRDKLADQKQYIEAVRKGEQLRGLEEREFSLSKSLEDRRRQQLATAMRLYRDGKVGFYGRLIENFSETSTGA